MYHSPRDVMPAVRVLACVCYLLWGCFLQSGVGMCYWLGFIMRKARSGMGSHVLSL